MALIKIGRDHYMKSEDSSIGNKEKVTWIEASRNEWTDGWKLPTKEQLEMMYQEFKKSGVEKKGNFENDYYWSIDQKEIPEEVEFEEMIGGKMVKKMKPVMVENNDKKMVMKMKKTDEAWYQNFNNGGKMYNATSLPARVRLIRKMTKDELAEEKKNNPFRHIDILKEGIKYWNDWRSQNKEIEPNLSGAELEGMDYSGINFSKTNLQMANLQGCNLTNANLENAKVNGAKFTNANLTDVNVEGVDFKWAVGYPPKS
jgi:hypothetical protein